MTTNKVEFTIIFKRRTFKVIANNYGSGGWMWHVRHMAEGGKASPSRNFGRKHQPTIDAAERLIEREFEGLTGVKP